MSDQLGLGITLALKDAFTRSAQTMRAQMGPMQKEATGLTGSFEKMNQQLQAVAGAVVFEKAKMAFAGLVNPAVKFERAMAEVSTLVDTSTTDMAQLSRQVLDMSKRFGTANVDQAKAMYQTLSAGVGGAAESMTVLTAANKLAIGGVTDVTTSVNGLTTILNAWKLKASDATDVTDTLFVAAAAGKTSIEEISQFIAAAAPLASTLGIKLTELTGAIANMSNQGTPTRIAMTQVNSALVGMLRPSDDLNAVWKQAGFASGAAAVRALGLGKALEVVRKAAKGNEGTMIKLLGSHEAFNTVAQNTGQNAAGLAKALALMETRSGATEIAFKKLQNTRFQRFAQIRETFEALKVTLGMSLLDALDGLVERFSYAAAALETFVNAHPQFAKALAVSLGLFAGLGIVLGGAAVAAGVLSLALSTTGAWILGLFAGLGGLIGLFSMIRSEFQTWARIHTSEFARMKDDWQSFKKFAADAWVVIRAVAVPVIKWMASNLVGAFMGAIGPVVAFGKKVFWVLGLVADLVAWLGKLVGLDLSMKGLADDIRSDVRKAAVTQFLEEKRPEFIPTTRQRKIEALPDWRQDIAANADLTMNAGLRGAMAKNAIPYAPTTIVNVPPAKIAPVKIELDKKVLATVVLEQQKQQSVRATE